MWACVYIHTQIASTKPPISPSPCRTLYTHLPIGQEQTAAAAAAAAGKEQQGEEGVLTLPRLRDLVRGRLSEGAIARFAMTAAVGGVGWWAGFVLLCMP